MDWPPGGVVWGYGDRGQRALGRGQHEWATEELASGYGCGVGVGSGIFPARWGSDVGRGRGGRRKGGRGEAVDSGRWSDGDAAAFIRDENEASGSSGSDRRRNKRGGRRRGGRGRSRRYRTDEDEDNDEGGGGGDANASVISSPAGRSRLPSEGEDRGFGQDRRGSGSGDRGGGGGEGGGGRIEAGVCIGQGDTRRRLSERRPAKGASVAVMNRAGGANGTDAGERAVGKLLANQRAEAAEQLLARERERMAREMETERAAFRDREAAREEERRREREVRRGEGRERSALDASSRPESVTRERDAYPEGRREEGRGREEEI